tara:strand:- start:25 stop:612 length:588 start_codon:yes stop_codon:yes gene_type:complete
MFEHVTKFERKIADFYGAPYAIATDSCTHAIELCLRLHCPTNVVLPKHTYLSIPMTMMKLDIPFKWKNSRWSDMYPIGGSNIIDAAVLWERDSYVSNKNMCLSFQFKKHLGLGRGGMILTDNETDYHELKKMVYDGRDLTKPWADQDITTLGFHYYMTPETAIEGIRKFNVAKDVQPKTWSWKDYPDLSKLTVFQ